ncbi:MAG: hypothetical protein KC464_05680, partial [Myxococcales bacterium]|nr:hypothetical protein [Myxococcales bacterium]
MGSPRVIGWALVALTAAGCPHPAAAPRPESVAPLAPWQAQVEAAAAGGPVDLDVSADGQVAATFTARAGARLG